MFIVRTEDAAYLGPRVNYFRAESASGPEEALAEARDNMEDWAQEKLDEGRIRVQVYRVSEQYVLKDGQLVPKE